MKKTILRFISILLIACAVLTMVGVVTVRGSGFLDLSNVARMVLCGIAILCVAFASAAWSTADLREKRAKLVLTLIAVIVIILIGIFASCFRVPATEITGLDC